MNKFIKCILVGCMLSITAYSETFKMSDTPIKTRISSKQLNRISVKNDRIESVIGIEEAFQFEKNEKTGDGYIRPTEANGKEPISISITTVSGKTQELVLNVDDGEANTITLENTAPEDFVANDVEVASENDNSSFVNSASSYETSITDSMKKLVIGDLVPIRLATKPSKKVPGFNIKHIGSYNVGKFIGDKRVNDFYACAGAQAAWDNSDWDCFFSQSRGCDFWQSDSSGVLCCRFDFCNRWFSNRCTVLMCRMAGEYVSAYIVRFRGM